MALANQDTKMKSYKNLYNEIISKKNLILAWRKARKGKTKKDYVVEFEKEPRKNLFQLHEELKLQTYCPKPLITFVLRDPKTCKISKSDFRDRIVHHALINIIEPIFDKTFIYDSCANRKGRGNLFARFDGVNLITYNKEAFKNKILPYLKHPKKINNSNLVIHNLGNLEPRFVEIINTVRDNEGLTNKELAQLLSKKKIYAQVKFLKGLGYVYTKDYPKKIFINKQKLENLIGT